MARAERLMKGGTLLSTDLCAAACLHAYEDSPGVYVCVTGIAMYSSFLMPMFSCVPRPTGEVGCGSSMG